MIKIVEGDILEANENIICHQVNCIGVMGGGVALQLARKYPKLKIEYEELCKSDTELLGEVSIFRIGFGQWVANLFGQYGISGYRIQTNYGALGNAFLKVKNLARNIDYSLCAPYFIGCGLGGGDWNLVKGILEKVFDNYDITLYRLTD